MKKLICGFMSLVLCLSFVGPVMAEEEFVPSISYKGAPDVVPTEDGYYGIMLTSDDWEIIENGELGEECIEITPISEVEDFDDIPEDEKKTILDVYEQLTDGTMEIPYEDDFKDEEMVIRDLFDLRVVCDDGHDAELAKDGVLLEMTFDLGIDADTEVSFMVYVDGEWVPAAKIVNNGDGTVTVAFENAGLVAISVPSDVEAPKTGDTNGNNIVLWSGVMVAAAVVLVALVIFNRKAKTAK